jgi:hypothetical protein
MTVAAGATGARAWLAARRPLGLSTLWLGRLTVVLLAVALVLAATAVG